MNYTKAKIVKDRGIQLSGGKEKEAFVPTDLLPGVKDAFIHDGFLIITGDGDESLSINSLDPKEIQQHILDNVKAGFSFKGSNSSLVDEKSPSLAVDTSAIHNRFSDLADKINQAHAKFTSEPPIVPQQPQDNKNNTK